MGYAHIANLYRPEAQHILLFKECYAMEKIHGTSAHISFRKAVDGAQTLHFSSGGEKYERFVNLFDAEKLKASFAALGHRNITVYGEAYGGSQQRQAWRYGDTLRFIAFDVNIDNFWLSVPSAHDVCTKLGIEFVHYEKASTDIPTLDRLRDQPSTQAKRNGVNGDPPQEGIVIRPLVEMALNDGERICAKHKRAEERETATPRKVVDPSQLQVLTQATDIAQEWVTETRLDHVMDKVCPNNLAPEMTPLVVDAMLEDVLREGSGEFADSKETRAAIKKRAAKLFNERCRNSLREVK